MNRKLLISFNRHAAKHIAFASTAAHSHQCDEPLTHLLRSYLVLKLSSYKYFAANAEKLYNVGCKTIGAKAVNNLMRRSFYKQFVAGETVEQLSSECEKMLQKGPMLAMLCPPMEDLAGKTENFGPKMVANTGRCIEYIRLAHDLNASQPGQRAVVQFKPTGVFPAELMEFYSTESKQKQRSLRRSTEEFIEIMTSESDNVENKLMDSGIRYCASIFQEAARLSIPVLIDGELRSTHHFLHALSLSASALHNHLDAHSTIIFDTFQCYLNTTESYLDECLQVSKALNFRLGAKIVRGAYMETERKRAAQAQQSSHLFDSHAATSENYDRIIAKLLCLKSEQNDSLALYIATMNPQSIQKSLDKLDLLGLGPDTRELYFAQIYGMTDHLSIDIAKRGFRVYKSTPWGRLEEWLPYLARRAAENYSAFQTARNELPLYRRAIRQRLLRQ